MGVDRWHSPPLRPLLRMLLLLVSLTVCSAAGERLQCEELLDLATRITRSDDVELPTLVLVGHKNDGKSSLFEALLGLKLTHVGNDAATRRPLVVTSQYDPAATEPVLYLKRNGQEERVRLDDLRSYLQAENLRLEEAGTYEAEPVHVRLIWKRASTLVLIDTPGLIGDTQNEELAALKEYVEQIVAAQIMPPKRLILCLEDTSDWALVNTMGVVSRIDPDLKRTVLVATKLDAKMAQFAMPEDLRGLIDPPKLISDRPKLLAGPIFTSVPPLRADSRFGGRKGNGPLGGSAAHLGWGDLIEEHEASLRRVLSDKLNSDEYADRIGISALREALEPHVASRWLELATDTSRELDKKIAKVQRELNAPPPPPAAQTLEEFADRFAKCVNNLIKGSAVLSAEEYGETLKQEIETSSSGALCSISLAGEEQSATLSDLASGLDPQSGAPAPPESWANIENDELTMWLHSRKRLFGGAQYWRALHEFMLGAAEGPSEEVTTEEILNAMGFDGYHDGVNYMRAVSVIVVEKARGYFEQHLSLLRLRLLHVMRRMTSQVDAMLSADELPYIDEEDANAGLFQRNDISHEQHRRLMTAAAPLYISFVDKAMESCMRKCMYDVEAITKYVVWDSSSATKESLYNVFVQPVAAHLRSKKRTGRKPGEDKVAFESYEELVASFTEVLTSRRVTEQMRQLMSALVCEIITAWRQEFCRMISLKLNTFFLMPFCESLAAYMRNAMLKLGEDGAIGFAQADAHPAARMESLRSELSSLTGEKAALQRIGSRMQANALSGRSAVMNGWSGHTK